MFWTHRRTGEKALLVDHAVMDGDAVVIMRWKDQSTLFVVPGARFMRDYQMPESLRIAREGGRA